MINTEQTKKKKKREVKIESAKPRRENVGKKRKRAMIRLDCPPHMMPVSDLPFLVPQAQQNFYLIGSGGRQPWPTSGLTLDIFAM